MTAADSTRLGAGDPAPDFTLPDVMGGARSLDPEAHTATVVVFTANDCPYALAWHDRIQAVARDWVDRDVLVLQIVSNDVETHPDDSPDAMRDRVEAGEIAGPFLHDPDQAVAAMYGATATPDVFVIDRTGIVRYHGAPDAAHDDPSLDAMWLRDALEDVVAGRDVRLPATAAVGCSIKWRAELLWWEGCPSHGDAERLLRAVLDDAGRGEVPIVRREVRTMDQARELAFPGSPTFRIGGRDLYPTDAQPALTCRVYDNAAGGKGPLPEPAALALRVRAATMRPWELPGWIDPRGSSS